MATPWRSEEERNEYFEKLKLEDSVETSLLKLAEKEFDNMICKDIIAVLKKYFPNSTLDEQKVPKLAKMLIAEEKEGKEEKAND